MSVDPVHKPNTHRLGTARTPFDLSDQKVRYLLHRRRPFAQTTHIRIKQRMVVLWSVCMRILEYMQMNEQHDRKHYPNQTYANNPDPFI
jgi:hypothetical protein